MAPKRKAPAKAEPDPVEAAEPVGKKRGRGKVEPAPEPEPEPEPTAEPEPVPAAVAKGGRRGKAAAEPEAEPEAPASTAAKGRGKGKPTASGKGRGKAAQSESEDEKGAESPPEPEPEPAAPAAKRGKGRGKAAEPETETETETDQSQPPQAVEVAVASATATVTASPARGSPPKPAPISDSVPEPSSSNRSKKQPPPPPAVQQQQQQQQQQQPPPPPPVQQQQQQQQPPPPPAMQQQQQQPPPPPAVQQQQQQPPPPPTAQQPPPPPPPVMQQPAPPPPAVQHQPSPPPPPPSSSTMVTAMVAVPPVSRALVTRPPPPALPAGRTSSLAAPTLCLTGHESAVLSASFEPIEGRALATAGMDGKVFLWDVMNAGRELKGAVGANYNVLAGHKSAVTECHWLPSAGAGNSGTLVTSSADHSCGLWDCSRGIKTRKLDEHTGIVNSCCVAQGAQPLCPHLVGSGADDCTAILWDVRCKKSVATMFHSYQVTAVCLSGDGLTMFTGGIDNIVRGWDLRARAGAAIIGTAGGQSWDWNQVPDTPGLELETESMGLSGHFDTITGLSLSPDGQSLLSNSMDASLRLWDVRPFSPAASRQLSLLTGHRHGAEKLLLRCAFSPCLPWVAAGSADRAVHVWNLDTGAKLYHLGGHTASVNCVVFHPSQPVVASVSSDRTVLVGELA